MLFISEAVAKRVVTMTDAIVAIETAFAALASGDAEIFPVVVGRGSFPSSSFSMKGGLIRDQRLVGLKVGTYWPRNRDAGLKSHGSTTLFLDDETGFPRALVAASYLTAIRTAAADGVAVEHLARPDASTLGIVGTGHQAWFELLAVREVRPIRRVLLWGRDRGSVLRFATRAREELGLEAVSPDLETVCRSSDIIVTATSAREPLVKRDWVRPGAHISAMGADGPGKQELDVALVDAGTLFADSIEQSITIGEFEAAYKEKVIGRGRIRSLGSVIVGTAAGREHPDAITIFDSSGLSVQDLAIGSLALSRAVEAGLAQSMALD